MPISNKPWGQFSESDYDPDQWYEACLIKPPKSEYTAKAQAKLPVREPVRCRSDLLSERFYSDGHAGSITNCQQSESKNTNFRKRARIGKS